MPKNKDTLNGQPFIAKTSSYGFAGLTPEGKRAPGQRRKRSARECKFCFYRYGVNKGDFYPWLQDPSNDPFGNGKYNCAIVLYPEDQTPHDLFGVERGKFLPEQIDGKEVGNFCPFFEHFNTPYDYSTYIKDDTVNEKK
jgi:hypothetical protein